jgi:hypothetical protein
MTTFANKVTGKENAIEGLSLKGAGTGVVGTSKGGIGVFGESAINEGVRGVSHGEHAGVVGINDSTSTTQNIDPRLAVVHPGGGSGGWFESNQGEGVRGISKHAGHGGVVGVNTEGGIGVYGTSDNGVGVSGIGRTGGSFDRPQERGAPPTGDHPNEQSDALAAHAAHR